MDKPTKTFLEGQIRSCQQAIDQNQGAINLLRAMIEKEIYMEEGKEEGR